MKYYGKFKGIVRDIHDPWQAMRIRAEVPYPLGLGEENWSVWAMPCLPPGHVEVPDEDTHCWIEFVDGDVNQPIWVGVWYPGRGTNTTVPWQGTHAALTDWAGTVVDRDKLDHTLPDSTDHLEHSEWHNHTSEFYSPHEKGWLSSTGHFLRFGDHPGKDAFVWLADRFNRYLRFFARGVIRLRSAFEPAATGRWKDIDGTDIDGYHEFVMADIENDATHATAGKWMMLRDMAQAFLKFTSTAGDEKIELLDIRNQGFRVRTKLGQEFLEIMDRDGQKIKLDPVANTIRIDDVSGNYILMAAGKITIFVSPGSKVHVGGEAGQQLATKSFVQTYYNTHKHSTPSGPSGPPLTQAPLTPGTDITNKTWGE